ncbi:MAG: tRNA lysidine(34) synthetase TilS [Pseudomonadales bacterium]|nr:tRNA lysidine(34) synthetase TilS [Pseudomonadales bacterium]
MIDDIEIGKALIDSFLRDVSLSDSPLSQQSSGRIVVGYSGGLDSHVLLHLVSRLFAERSIHALHINHGLHIDADKWESHCEEICRELNVAYTGQKVEVERSGNLENEARIARYQVFEDFLEEGDTLLLGHHQDDQIETLFLKMFRGDAPMGLQGMPMTRTLAKATLYRPFLRQQRKDLYAYACDVGLEWIEDSSNQNMSFDRNFLRQQILPQLVSRWPRLKTTLLQHEVRTKSVQSELQALSEIDYQKIALPPGRLDLVVLGKLSLLRQVNLMRTCFLKAGLKHLPSEKLLSESLNGFFRSKEDSQPRLSWQGFIVDRFSDHLYFHKELHKALPKILNQPLVEIDKGVDVENGRLVVKRTESGGLMLNSDAVMSIRYREGGEKMKFGGQHKTLKNIFQENKMPAFLRDHWPLIYLDEELVLIPGISAWSIPTIVAPAQKDGEGVSAWSIAWQFQSGNFD